MLIKTVSSLDKVFPDIGPKVYESEGLMLRNERFHFQVAVKSDVYGKRFAKLVVSGDLAEYCTVRAVDMVPALFTKYNESDSYYIFGSEDARLYPDVLRNENSLNLINGKWMCFWVTVHSENGLPAGMHKIGLEVVQNGEALGSTEYSLEVLDVTLPKSDIVFTNWMHYDAIANYYHVEPWSEEFYKYLTTFIRSAVTHGVNMLYVPLFTPPLDTHIGGERRDVQLIKVTRKNGKYTFDFGELERFITLAVSLGVEYFEMCHLATQWGAYNCPKITAVTENGYERIFGWDTPSTGEEYLGFLSECISGVDKVLKKLGVDKKCYFHISDEPNADTIGNYRAVYNCIKPILKDYKIIEAMTHEGKEMIDVPVIATSHIDGELNPNEFTYYCCSSHNKFLSNRFINMPSERNRILGYQLYMKKVNGFLQWGFNFYNDGGSYHAINPFLTTDADGHFPAGDSFIVYPGADGALDSIRHEVFFDAFQDRMLLKLLESYIGREKCLEFLANEGVEGWSNYPHSAQWLIDTDKKLKRMVAAAAGK